MVERFWVPHPSVFGFSFKASGLSQGDAYFARAFRNSQFPLLCQDLHDLTGMDMVAPMNSGAEAVETAVKAARKWGYQVKIFPRARLKLSCAGNFHGRTVTIVSFSSHQAYPDGFGLSGAFPSAMPRLCARPSLPTPARFSLNPFRVKRASSFLPTASCVMPRRFAARTACL